MKILNILAEDKSLISYRPKLNQTTHSVLSTILLQQILHWWRITHKQKFYKFFAPCTHEKYKKGDSWSEELGFTKCEFTAAIKNIGFKLGKTANKIKKEDAFVIYYRDNTGLTWYDINSDLLSKSLSRIYQEDTETVFTKQVGKTDLPITTETTTETTTKNIPPNPMALELSELLFGEIQKRKPDYKKPNLVVWAKDIDSMLRLDNRKPERIKSVIRWCQTDPFWQNNILSAEKLRKQFDQLELKMEEQDPPARPFDPQAAAQRERMKEPGWTNEGEQKLQAQMRLERQCEK